MKTRASKCGAGASGGNKSLLAMDESNPTCNKRLARWGISQTEKARRAYRELIVATPGLAERISGVILYDETISQKEKDGTPFVKAITDAGITPGIGVDSGTEDMNTTTSIAKLKKSAT